MTHSLAKLGVFVAEVPAHAIPRAARARAGQALVDFVGVTLAGLQEPVSQLITRLVSRDGSGGRATIIGTGRSTGVLDAALANGTVGHALDLDDSNFALGGHPTVTLLPAILALAEQENVGGDCAVDAYVVGFEVLIRIARAVNFHHYEKGWHPTATLGVFGAAAAAARLLRLDADRTLNALGLAASFASGIKQNFGTMAKPIQVGHASQKGVLAALLAAEGATASPSAFDGKQGFLTVYNGAGHYAEIPLEGLGEQWELLESGLMFKKYACCGTTHPVIDAAIDLVARDKIDAGAIERVDVRINPRRIPHVDRPVVADTLAAKFSVQYTAAAALSDGAVGLRHFSDEAVARPDLQALLSRVHLSGLDSVASELSQACELAVRLQNGDRHSIRLEAAHGRRAEDYELFRRMKFLDCAGQSLAASDAQRLLDRLEGFEQEPSVAAVMAMMSTTAGRSPHQMRAV